MPRGRVGSAFVARVRGKDPARCPMVPIDVGKRVAAALVEDLYGEVVVDAFRFDLDEPGAQQLGMSSMMSSGGVRPRWSASGSRRPGTTTAC